MEINSIEDYDARWPFGRPEYQSALRNAPLTAIFLESNRERLTGDSRFDPIKQSLATQLLDPSSAERLEREVFGRPEVAREMNYVMESARPGDISALADVMTNAGEAQPRRVAIHDRPGDSGLVVEAGDGLRVYLAGNKQRMEAEAAPQTLSTAIGAATANPYLNWHHEVAAPHKVMEPPPAVADQANEAPSLKAQEMARQIMETPGSKLELLNQRGRLSERSEFIADPEADKVASTLAIARRVDEMLKDVGRSGGSLQLMSARGELMQAVLPRDLYRSHDDETSYLAGAAPVIQITQPSLALDSLRHEEGRVAMAARPLPPLP